VIIQIEDKWDMPGFARELQAALSGRVAGA
jgi:hypothetical protein